MQRHRDVKRQSARACVKASIPRGVARRAECEAVQAFETLQTHNGPSPPEQLLFQLLRDGKAKTRLRGLCVSWAFRALRCVSACLAHCKYLNFCLFKLHSDSKQSQHVESFLFCFIKSAKRAVAKGPRSSHMELAVGPEHIV